MQNTRISSVITREIQMEFVDAEGATTSIDTEFQYRASDPFAVTVVFKTAEVPVTWTFARELLISGLHEPSGQGDVQVWPCLSNAGAAVVILELISPAGEVLVQGSTREMYEFVTEILDCVPAGQELDMVDLDDELYALLAS